LGPGAATLVVLQRAKIGIVFQPGGVPQPKRREIAVQRRRSGLAVAGRGAKKQRPFEPIERAKVDATRIQFRQGREVGCIEQAVLDQFMEVDEVGVAAKAEKHWYGESP